MSRASATIVSTDSDGCIREPSTPAAVAEGPLLVLKFGGTAVGTPARIRRAAKRVRKQLRSGARVVVVVSATGDTTDRIVRWLNAVAPESGSLAAREIDRALATGEDLSAALLASALLALGVRAVSLRGGEAGLEAAGAFGAGEIRELQDGRLRSLLDEGVVPVVSGFQAVGPDGETVTLGRGGSDTTAAYLAGALGASACHIVTDVDGVYDRDPRLDPSARHLASLPYDALISLAEGGAQVVHPAAAVHARRSGTPLHVYSFRAPPVPVRSSHVGPATERVVSSSTSAQPGAEPHAGGRGRDGGITAETDQSPGRLEFGPVAGVRVVPIALAGCGVVGSDLVRLLQAHGPAIEQAHGVRLELVSVLVREPEKGRSVDLSSSLFTRDVEAFLRTHADVVVEAMGGLDPAERIARATLERGARFVTANKALVGAVGADLVALARASGGSLDFEAAVGGGIPVIRVLRDALSEGPVHRIRAILNGTTNYILTQLERGIPFHHALHEAQRNGFAEADPTRDLDGTDAGDKIRILAWLAYGVPPHALPVRCRGILPDPDRLARDAEAVGGSVRLIAECTSQAGEISASVEPVIVPVSSEFARTTEEQNHVAIDLGWSRPVALSGPGAGGLPTASALLGDILRSCAPLPDLVAPGAVPSVEHRPHRWLVSAGRGRGGLLACLDGAGLQVEPIPEDSAAHDRVLVSNCGWTRLEASLRSLEIEGQRPLATRVDSPQRTGAGLPDQPPVVATLC